MGQDSFIPVATNARSRNDLVERGFSRRPLGVDAAVARGLPTFAGAPLDSKRSPRRVLNPGSKRLPGATLPNRPANMLKKEKQETSPQRGAMNLPNREKIVGD
jgi:hypothetical protein